MCCTLWLSTPVPPKGVLEYPSSTPRGYRSAETHGRQREVEIDSAIRAPRSGRILLRRDPIFELVKHRRQRSPQTRIFSPQLISGWSAGGRLGDAASAKKWRGMRPSILTIHRTVTTRRADFAVRLTRRDRRAPLMMLVHEECRITCDHRHSLWYLTCSSDCGLSRNAIQQWSVHDFVPMTAAPGNRGKRKPERRVPNATFRQLAVTRLNTVRALHPRSVL